MHHKCNKTRLTEKFECNNCIVQVVFYQYGMHIEVEYEQVDISYVLFLTGQIRSVLVNKVNTCLWALHI